MTGVMDWQARVGDVWAAEWRRTDRSFTELSARLDAAILAAAPDRGAIPDHGPVLDIGCGAGATSRALADARPDLAVTGIDLSPALLAVARTRVPQARFVLADAAHLPADIRPALMMSRHGVMFFADPVAAFARLHDRAGRGAALVFTCFGAVERNAFAHDLVVAVSGRAPPPSAPHAPGPFAFADPESVAGILTAAGWRDLRPVAVPFGYVAGGGEDPVSDAAGFLGRIGPVARLIADAPPASRGDLHMRLTDALARYRIADRVVLPALAWLWQARAA